MQTNAKGEFQIVSEPHARLFREGDALWDWAQGRTDKAIMVQLNQPFFRSEKEGLIKLTISLCCVEISADIESDKQSLDKLASKFIKLSDWERRSL